MAAVTRRTSNTRTVLQSVALGAALVSGCAATDTNQASTNDSDLRPYDDEGPVLPGVGGSAEGGETARPKAVDTAYYTLRPTTFTGKITMASTYSHVCALSELAGDFSNTQSNPDRVYITVDANDNYVLEAGANRRGSALCTRKSNFQFEGGSFITARQYSRSIDNARNPATHTVNMGTGFGTVGMIMGVDGEMEGGGEYSQITQPNSSTSPVVLTVHTESGGIISPAYYSGLAQAVQFTGLVPDGKAKLVGYNPAGTKVRGTISSAGTFEMSVSTESGYSAYWLAASSPTAANGGFCYFTRISGDFDDLGDRAIIAEESSKWKLTAVKGHDRTAVYARARCLAYNQRRL